MPLCLLAGLVLIHLIGSCRQRFFVAFFLSVTPWLYWSRFAHDFGSHTIAGLHMTAERLQYAVDRLPAAVDAIQRMWIDIRQWSIVGWGMGIAWVYLLFSLKTQNRLALLLPAFMLAAFLTVVLFHTADITWQVNPSWNRLSVQVFPLFFVIVIPEIWRRLPGSVKI